MESMRVELDEKNRLSFSTPEGDSLVLDFGIPRDRRVVYDWLVDGADLSKHTELNYSLLHMKVVVFHEEEA